MARPQSSGNAEWHKLISRRRRITALCLARAREGSFNDLTLIVLAAKASPGMVPAGSAR